MFADRFSIAAPAILDEQGDVCSGPEATQGY